MTNKGVPIVIATMMVKLACPPDGVVLDLFPSESTAEAVLAAGRKYAAISTDEALLEGIGSRFGADGNGLFDDGVLAPTEATDEDGGRPKEAEGACEAHEAVQEA